MKLACASGAFHRAFERGDLTQIEFLELCAREIACDGVVLDARHFPRTDSDYLAQIKKMATDLGLDIAALQDDALFAEADTVTDASLSWARELGAPLVAARLAGERDIPWTEQLMRLNRATAQAKTANVTLAVRNARETYAAGVTECKRVSKEADSAWLRFGARGAGPRRGRRARPIGVPNGAAVERRGRTDGAFDRRNFEHVCRLSRLRRDRRAIRHDERRRCAQRDPLLANRARSAAAGLKSCPTTHNICRARF